MMARPNIVQLNRNLYAALEQIGSEAFLNILTKVGQQLPGYLRDHLEMEHSTPSPSGIMDCRLAQWYKATGVPREGAVPAAWTKRATVGTIMEPFWIAVLRFTGADVTLPPKSVPCGPHMMANPDALWEPDGIVELKDRNGWVYKRLLEGTGIKEEEPRSYYQIQSYLHATGREWGLYMATPADPGMLQSTMRNYKKYGKEWNLPLFYLEVVDQNEEDVALTLSRAEMVVKDIQSTTPPPREYDGQLHQGLHACNICAFRTRCNLLYKGEYSGIPDGE